MLYLLTQKGRLSRTKAKELYQSVLRQSRNPYFYTSFGVPDTLEGRFEIIILHSGLLVNRLCRPDMGREGKILAQAYFDVMFKNIDWSLRESGVGDLAVPRRIKKMMSDFKGRAFAYDEACRAGQGELIHALIRNIFLDIEKPSTEALNEFSSYIQSCVKGLDEQGLSDFWRGQIHLPTLNFYHNEYGTNNATQAA